MNNGTHANLIGTWRLVSIIREDVATKKPSDFFGPNPYGYLTYGPNGRMMTIFVRSDRIKPAGAAPTATESEALFRSVVSYAGTYEIEGDMVVHHVDVSWNELWTGTDQRRFFKLSNDRLAISTAPTADPNDGKTSVYRLIWDRMR